jgi:hypothetical protein
MLYYADLKNKIIIQNSSIQILTNLHKSYYLINELMSLREHPVISI